MSRCGIGAVSSDVDYAGRARGIARWQISALGGGSAVDRPETSAACLDDASSGEVGAETIGNDVLMIALHGAHGRRVGYVAIVKPELRAAVLGMLALGDARLFERMSGLLEPARRPGAVLFADLEASSSLARRLSTPAYFALIGRLARRGGPRHQG